MTRKANSKSPVTEQPFMPPVRKLAVWYEATYADGAQLLQRIFIDWAADIRLSQDLENVEREIIAQSGGQVVSALITHWRALEN